MKKCLSLIIILFSTSSLISYELNDNFSVKAVVDVFYSYDFNEPDNHVRQPFFYHFNRHNEVNPNMALVSLDYQNKMVRGNLTLQAGTYAQDNYAAEESLVQNIFESYLGIRLTESGSVWMDAGIFGSHLGFESAINHENPVLTRSFSSESSPYFLSGVRANWQINDNFLLGGVISNGWQRISRVEGNQSPAIGFQMQYNSGDLKLNYSNFLFNDDQNTDINDGFNRFFNNFYVTKAINNLDLLAGVDIGIASYSDPFLADRYDSWVIATVIASYKFMERNKVSLRTEYIDDPNHIVIPNLSIEGSEFANQGFETFAYSIGYDRIIGDGLFVRSEVRYLQYQNNHETSLNNLVDDNLAITFSISKTFD